MLDSAPIDPNPPDGKTPRVPEKPGAHHSVFLLVTFLAVVVIVALYAMSALSRLNNRMARLEQENERLQARVAEVERRSQSAAQKANQAAESAQAAASQRDQAQVAQAQSESAAQTARQQAAAAEQTAEEFRREREAELEHVQQILSQIVETRRTGSGLVMTLGSNSIRFDFDKSDIKPPYRETLSRIAGVLMTLKGYSIYVYGYTDDVGTQDYNLQLSDRRAKAVRNYLVQSGLESNILTTKGFGKSDPRVKGETAEARAKNRRVEIGIVDSTLHVVGQVPPPK
ncbi:MAG TPA: OmpA family protein [Terriglobia bacterium]|nr:OmpA family protein [Terriglobia bacterium]